MSNINNYLLQYGFVIIGNEIYGGRSGYYDYGHLGVLLKRNIQRAWEEYFISSKENTYFLDASIFTSEEVWKASGHMQHFNDVLVDCKKCKKRYRQDHLPENQKCPNCGTIDWTESKPFNLIFKAQENNYLRPETAQSIFINFKNILRTSNAKIPFCVGQVGKAFRNEVTISHFIFRTKEFEQMECEWFVHKSKANECFEKCVKEMQEFLLDKLNINSENIKIIEIDEADRAHYSSRSVDIEFKFPHGWGELWGLANRTNFDLQAHQINSNKDMSYLDPQTNEKYIPYVIEHSIGLNRLLFALVSNAYVVQQLENGDSRELLKIKAELAPYFFAVLPLTKNEKNIAYDLFKSLIKKGISVAFMDKGSIGKRYRKNDAIGTPYCITVDQESNPNNLTFTIRERDSMKQKRIDLKELEYANYKISF